MNIQHIDYVVDIGLDGFSGKGKGSKEKAKKLIQTGKDVQIWSLKKNKARSLSKLFHMFWLELSYLTHAISRKTKPDVIFTRSFFGFGTWITGKLYKAPVIREVHGDLWGELKLLFSNRKYLLPFLWAAHRYTLFFIKRSDGLIFNNSKLEDYFRIRYSIDHEKTVTIPNGCNTSHFFPIETKLAREKLSLEPDKKYLLFIGSVSKWHGVHFLIDIQKVINRTREDVVLLVVGGHDFSESEKLKSLTSEKNIVFTGKVPYNEALLYINAADVCLVPVNNIRVSPGSPIKLYDAVSCGKPVITQVNTPGYSDITEKHNLGATCDFPVSEQAAAEIIEFLDNANYEYFLEHNRKVAVNHLDWDIRINQWLQFAAKIKS